MEVESLRERYRQTDRKRDTKRDLQATKRIPLSNVSITIMTSPLIQLENPLSIQATLNKMPKKFHFKFSKEDKTNKYLVTFCQLIWTH